MDLMLSWGTGSAIRTGPGLNKLFDLAEGALAGGDATRASRQGSSQKPVAPGPGVADALRDAREPKLKSRTGRIWEDQPEIGARESQSAPHHPRVFVGGKGQDGIQCRRLQPEAGEFLRC